MKISIIVVTYNSINLIKDCIDSIFYYGNIGNENIEIIVVDNSSEKISRNLFKYLRGLYNDKIILIKNVDNLGYGSGNNLGIEVATGDIIGIMNPDVRIIQPLFEVVQMKFESNHNLGLLGFRQKGGANLSYYLKPEYYLSFLNSFVVRLANYLGFFHSRYFFLSGAFFFVSKSKFEHIGWFDDNIFMYLEEPDISNRFLSKNYSIQYFGRISYEHLNDASNALSSITTISLINSLKYYLEKFNINERMYFRKMILHYRLFTFLSLFGNKKRFEKYKGELALIKDNWGGKS